MCLEQLSYHEAWELSYFGANVLHPRTTLPAMKFRHAAAAFLSAPPSASAVRHVPPITSSTFSVAHQNTRWLNTSLQLESRGLNFPSAHT